MLRRFIAYVLDWYIMYFIMNLILVISYYIQEGIVVSNLIPIQYFNSRTQIQILLILCAFFIVYTCVLPLLWDGKTIGKKICKIKVKSLGKLTFTQLVVRNLFGIVILEGCLNPLSNYIRNVFLLYVSRDLVQYMVYFSTFIGIVSIICMFVTPKKKMIHDLISKTEVGVI